MFNENREGTSKCLESTFVLWYFYARFIVPVLSYSHSVTVHPSSNTTIAPFSFIFLPFFFFFFLLFPHYHHDLSERISLSPFTVLHLLVSSKFSTSNAAMRFGYIQIARYFFSRSMCYVDSRSTRFPYISWTLRYVYPSNHIEPWNCVCSRKPRKEDL